jgi:hypothetical protein
VASVTVPAPASLGGPTIDAASMSLFDIIYDAGPNGLWVFMLCTVVLGGTGAYIAGQAIAETWRPFWTVFAASLGLMLVVRFMHYALFHEPLVSLRNAIVDAAILIVAAIAGYIVTRRRQMVMQYGFARR